MAILVIPARHGSKRLPGKPLLRETGRPLILHVVKRALAAASVSRVIVATDDERIERAVIDGGGEAVLSRAAHDCGTSRVAEVAESLPDETYFVNLQGDEPEIDPDDIDLLVRELEGSGVKPCVTVGFPLGAASKKVKAVEAKEAVENGAREVDMVINVAALQEGDFAVVEDDIRAVCAVAEA